MRLVQVKNVSNNDYYLYDEKCSGLMTNPPAKYPAQYENVPCDMIV